MVSRKLFASLAGALLVSAITAAPAAATTITITGGDAGEGYAPLASTFAAVNLGAASAFTVQGVTFAASDAHIALSSVTTSNENVASLGASANDLALLAIVQSSVGDLGNITVTISGLTVGLAYQLDYFVAYQGAGRTEQFSSVGQTTVVDSLVYPTIGVPGPTFDIQQTLMPSAAGTIVTTISITSPAPDFGTIINGLSVTTAQAGPGPAPVPEPGTMILIGTGVTAALARRRSKSTIARR
jgi:PEP-CTERM motif-containing protein